MTNEFIVESGGFTFVVPKNHNFKFELLEGQQIIDVAIWSKDNPKKERIETTYGYNYTTTTINVRE